MAHRLRTASFVALAALALAGCGGDDDDASTTATTTDRGVVEASRESRNIARFISNGITEQLGVVLYVECPPEISSEPGTQFECTARSTDSEVLPISATVQDEQRNVEWGLDAISTTGIARTIAGEVLQRRRLTATVDCPDVVRPKRGDDFECELRTRGNVTYPLRATFTDDSGKVTWKVLEAASS